VRERYGVKIEVVFPEAAAVQELVQTKGLYSFYEDGHKECCSIRKVQPLRVRTFSPPVPCDIQTRQEEVVS